MHRLRLNLQRLIDNMQIIPEVKETFIFFKAVDETEISLRLMFESTNIGIKGGGGEDFDLLLT